MKSISNIIKCLKKLTFINILSLGWFLRLWWEKERMSLRIDWRKIVQIRKISAQSVSQINLFLIRAFLLLEWLWEYLSKVSSSLFFSSSKLLSSLAAIAVDIFLISSVKWACRFKSYVYLLSCFCLSTFLPISLFFFKKSLKASIPLQPLHYPFP